MPTFLIYQSCMWVSFGKNPIWHYLGFIFLPVHLCFEKTRTFFYPNTMELVLFWLGSNLALDACLHPIEQA